MGKKLKLAIDQWREADAMARNAEAQLSKRLKEFEQRRGPAVPRELIEEVAQLREQANQKLSAAVASIGDRDDAHGSRPIEP
jgi:hypothetical protein